MSVSIVRPTDEPMEHLITPHFMHLSLENIPQSYNQRRPVIDVREVVQLRFAGDKNFAPVFGVNEVYRSDGINDVTYAERFSTQYRAFLNGDAQLADGTPLEKLVEYGITPAHISLCRALKIHSVEALAHLEGANLKSSGAAVANVLKPMAQRYLEDRSGGAEVARELAALRAELAALKSGSVVIPAETTPEVEVDAMINDADEKEALKNEIAAITGHRPRGNPSVSSLKDELARLKG